VFWQSTSGRQMAAHHRSMFLNPLLLTSSCMMIPVLITFMAKMSMLTVPMTMFILMVLVSCSACIRHQASAAKLPNRLLKSTGV
jgi:hypothetical protein